MNSNKKNWLRANLLEQSTYQNGYSNHIPWANSIGFKDRTNRFHDQFTSHSLGEDFLANLGFNRNDTESEASIRYFLEPVSTLMLSYTNVEDNNHLDRITLPPSVPLKMALDVIINSRRSIRHYTGDKIHLVYLATILRAACGITTKRAVDLHSGEQATLNFRAASSAGGIYPIDLYIAALNVEGLEQAIYQYNPTEDCLVKVYCKNSLDKLLTTFSVTEDQINMSRSGFICLFIGSAAKSMRKYGNQGLSFTLQEIGSISQNIHLSVTALGLGSVDCASYYVNEAQQVLGLDGIYKHLFHTIVAGVSQ